MNVLLSKYNSFSDIHIFSILVNGNDLRIFGNCFKEAVRCILHSKDLRRNEQEMDS